ncbi:MAG: PorV/PorQ family protein [candidate division Zixibacteria bacterium]|nr:PorV/PorQ family protein [candidate division Zixibacteria bacterium]
MKRKTAAILFFFFFVWGAFVFKTPASGKTDNSGLSFLKFGMGAKAMGMGEAFVAQSGEVTSAWWNPAGLSGIEGIQVSFTHNQWFQDITGEHFTSALNFSKNTLGLSLAMAKVPDIQKREDPTDKPIALFDAHDVVFSFSFARSIKEGFALGLSVKWLYEKIDIHSASGVGFDLGGIYSPLENLKFGLAVLNLGQKMKFEREKFSLPTLYKVGMTYFVEKKNLNSDFVFGLDLVKPRDDEVKIHLGGEVSLYRALKIRLGYQTGYDEKDFSFGLGTSFRKYSIDYGYLPHKSDLGDVHSISLNIEI